MLTAVLVLGVDWAKSPKPSSGFELKMSLRPPEVVVLVAGASKFNRSPVPEDTCVCATGPFLDPGGGAPSPADFFGTGSAF